MLPIISHEFRLSHHSIVLLGNQELITVDDRPARNMALRMGARQDRICFIHVPSGHKGRGHKTIQLPDFTKPIEAEGTILKVRGDAAILQTADCPTVILCDTKTNNVVVAHAGRPALTPPTECATCNFSVLDAAYMQLRGHEKADESVCAHIVGSICGQCFVHDKPGAEEFVKPFDRYGEEIFTDRSKGALDLVRHIRKQLEWRGIPAKNIRHDGLCTKETPTLSSRRGGRYTTKNTIIVVRH